MLERIVFCTPGYWQLFRNTNVPSRYGSLKWGLIALFGGLSLILVDYLDLRPNSPSPYGIVAISLSIAFLIYFNVVKRELK